MKMCQLYEKLKVIKFLKTLLKKKLVIFFLRNNLNNFLLPLIDILFKKIDRRLLFNKINHKKYIENLRKYK